MRYLLIPLIAALAAKTVSAQVPVPVRDVSVPSTVSDRHFGFILNIRELSNGSVLVNDGKFRQLLKLDRTLSNAVVVIDSTADGAQSYGKTATPIIPYIADSSLFVDGATSTLLLYDPDGRFVRVVAPPKAQDLVNFAYGPTAVDKSGDIIYAVLPQA